MSDIVVLIHTISYMIGVFDQLAVDFLPGVQLRHILDEPLAEGIYQRGGLSASDAARLWEHVKAAEGIHSRTVLVTCSTLSPLLDNLRPLTALPLVKIDEAMFAAAVQGGPRLGVLATTPTSIQSAQNMVKMQAQVLGREIACEFMLVDGAFPALLSGKVDEHDRLIRLAVREISTRVNTVVLAEASMARSLAIIPEDERLVPIFSSPRLALEQVRQLLGELGWG